MIKVEVLVRVKSFIRNTTFGLIFEVIMLIFGLIVPRLIISSYGSEVNGLTSTINQLLAVLNLLQAGALGASIFSLYKPLAEDDFEKVSRVLAASRNFFVKMGTYFLIGTFLIAPISTFFMLDSEIDPLFIMASIIILGLNASFSFFFISKYDIVFAADQKRYILSLAGICERLSYYFILFYIIFQGFHFLFMYLAILTGNVIKIIYLETQYRKRYKRRIVNVKVGKDEKIKDRQYVMYTQIGLQIVSASPIIIISALYDLSLASVYAVYNLVQEIMLKLFNMVFNSVSAVFGNLVATGNKDSINKVSNLLQFIYISMGTLLLTGIVFLMPSFISLYIDNIADINYSYPLLVIMITVHLISFCIYQPIKTLINSFGLFKETYIQSVLTALIAVITSILFGMISMPLVLLGPTIFYFLTLSYQLILLKKRNPWLSFAKFGGRTIMMISLIFVSYLIYYLINLSIENWLSWIVVAILVTFISSLLILIYSFIFERSELKQCFEYITILFRKKSNNERT